MKIGKNRERPVPSEPEESVGDFLSRVYGLIRTPYGMYSFYEGRDFAERHEALPVGLIRKDAKRLYEMAEHLVNIRKALG